MQKSSVNKVILVGHIGNKPEGRYTPSGASTASFSLATNESWIDSENEKQERTEWHNIIAWNKLADFATEYLQKGQLIYIEGRLQTRIYKDKEDVINDLLDGKYFIMDTFYDKVSHNMKPFYHHNSNQSKDFYLKRLYLFHVFMQVFYRF